MAPGPDQRSHPLELGHYSADVLTEKPLPLVANIDRSHADP